MQSLYSFRSSSRPPRLEPVARSSDRPRSCQPPLCPPLPAIPSPLPALSIPPQTPPQPIILPKPVPDPLCDLVCAHIPENSTQNYSSSGSNHDPSSVCLAAMVHEFLEEEARVGSCGRSRCNCLDGACGGEGGCEPGEIDEAALADAEQFCEILEGVTSCTSSSELLLLADVANALDAETEKASNDFSDMDGSNTPIESLRRSVMKRLRQAGHNAGLCKSRWNHSNGLTAGDYEYIDVLLAKKDGKHDRFIVETDFRGQFEIARASEQYLEALKVIPRIFVGRPERLKQILKIMSGAAKRSLKKQGLLLPPWRKLRYLQAKWFSSYRRTTNEESQKLPSSDKLLRFLAFRGPRFCLEFTKEMDMLYFSRQFQGLHLDPILDRKEVENAERDYLIGEENAAERFVKRRNGTLEAERDVCTVMCTGWQPPAIDAKTTGQPHRRVSGLAKALKEAGIYSASKFQKPLEFGAEQQIVGVLS